MAKKLKTESKNDQSAPSESSEEGAWANLPIQQRMKIMQNLGFCDWATYAHYRWEELQPHTRALISEYLL